MEFSPTIADDWQEFTTLTSQFAKYREADDPQTVLRKGLIEEVQELKLEATSSNEHLTGEVGDILFYLSEISHFEDAPIDTANSETLSLYTQEGEMIVDVDDTVILSILRVVDRLNPRNDSLWYDENGVSISQANRPSGSTCLNGAFISLVKFAQQHDIDISQAMSQTIAKLQTRQRQPHVIDEMKEKKLATSLRQRAIGELTHTALRQAMMVELS